VAKKASGGAISDFNKAIEIDPEYVEVKLT
jgi:hypothetical protein